MPNFTKYDSDPEALAWARSRVEHQIARMEKFEQQARERGSDTAEQWRKFGNLLRMSFIGGEGCVIAAFDWRTPTIVAALTEEKDS